jgi:hypothetical protein
MGMTRGTRGERGAKLGRTLKKGLLYTLFELEIRLIHVIKLEYIQMGRSDMVEESSSNQGEVPWSFLQWACSSSRIRKPHPARSPKPLPTPFSLSIFV